MNTQSKIRILLTGASGTIGQQILPRLWSRRNELFVTIFDVETKHSKSIFKRYESDMTVVYGDIRDKASVQKVGLNQDVVIHLAAIIPPLADEKPKLTYQVNVEGTKNLIEALESSDTKPFLIYASSVSVYGDRVKTPNIKVGDIIQPSAKDEYGVTKVKAEQLIQNSTLNWTIFRLSAIMGVNNHKISKLMFHMPLTTALEITTPADAARAFVHAIFKQNQLSKKIFNLGGGESCRTTYKFFLAESFKRFGLGTPNFPTKAFAEKNFHCGYYADGNKLEAILKFRKDSMLSYFQKVEENVSPLKKRLASWFHPIIKWYLLQLSEPYRAFKRKDKEAIRHFFEV